jgi:hypothetical protein
MLRLAVNLNVNVEVFMAVSLRAPSYSDLWTLESEGSCFRSKLPEPFPSEEASCLVITASSTVMHLAGRMYSLVRAQCRRISVSNPSTVREQLKLDKIYNAADRRRVNISVVSSVSWGDVCGGGGSHRRLLR